MRLSPRLVLGGLLATLGCGEDYVLAEKSELLVLLTPPNKAKDVCAGTFETMEQDIVAVREIYGSETPLPILYHWTPRWHTAPEDFPCDRVDTACTITNLETNDASIYARDLAMTHEFVHAARGSGPMIIEEGLATMFDEPFHPIERLLDREELLEILHSDSFDIATERTGLGERSAHFVSFLIAEWGMDTVVEFTSREPSYYLAPFATWAADFEAVFGVSFEAAWSLYDAYPDCPPAQFHRPVAACEALARGDEPEATLTIGLSQAAVVERTLDCSADDVFGPRSHAGRESRGRTSIVAIDDPLAGGGVMFFDLGGQTGPASRAVLTDCGSCWDGHGILLTHDRPDTSLNWQSGNYVLILHQDTEIDGPITLSMKH